MVSFLCTIIVICAVAHLNNGLDFHQTPRVTNIRTAGSAMLISEQVNDVVVIENT